MPVILSGALPLTYPAALGLRPSDRPPPFALWRSFPFSAGSVAHQPLIVFCHARLRPGISPIVPLVERILMGKV